MRPMLGGGPPLYPPSLLRDWGTFALRLAITLRVGLGRKREIARFVERDQGAISEAASLESDLRFPRSAQR